MTLTPINKAAPVRGIRQATEQGIQGIDTKNEIKGAKKHVKRQLKPVIKSADPYFNHEAANKAAEMIMKMDDDEAEMFAYFTMAEILEDDIEKNARTLQRHLNEVVEKRIDRVKRAVLSSVSKAATEESVAYAQALAEIEKAYRNPYDYGYRFEETDFRRDPRTGRFQTKVNVNRQAKPMNDRQAQALGIPMKRGGKKNQQHDVVDSKNKAKYQQEYLQIAQFLDTVNASAKNPGDHKAFMHIRDKGTRRSYFAEINGKPTPGKDWDPNTQDVVALEARPAGPLSLGGASFGLAGALSDSQVRTINRADEHFGGFADDWYSETDPRNSNDRLYSRVRSASEFVNNVAPFGSKAQLAARFGMAVGEHGPQAERVIGPTARKTAYRYRGTEKKPEREVLRQFNILTERSERPTLTAEQTKQLRTKQARAERKWVLQEAERQGKPVESIRITPDAATKIRRDTAAEFVRDLPVDPEKQAAGRAVLADYLLGKNMFQDREGVPDRDLYTLQLESGNTPPSEGFLLDKNGQIVAQAVGYGDDHYLPFNLKNLKRLKGGEYIRSRSVGGPTSEDIYTGLMSGAKRLTVVSRSGTFTVEFEDDFVGSRRYNDKARRMTRRYEQLLDAVQSEQVSRNQSIAPSVKAKMVRDIREAYPSLSAQDRRQLVKQREEEYKQELASSRDEVIEYAEARAGNLDEREKRQFVAQVLNDHDRHQEYQFRLNGLGYGDALKALQEQFPYYIKVTSHPTKDPERFEGERDKGYVEPGRNRPTAAQAGLFGTRTNPRGAGERGGKFSASQADYQGGRKSTTARAAAPQQRQEQQPKAATTPEGAEPVTEAETKAINQKAEEGFVGAATRLVQAFQRDTQVDASAKQIVPALGMQDEAEIKRFFEDKTNVRRADEFFQSVDPLNEQWPESVRTAFADYRKNAGLSQRVPYTPERALTRSGAPFLFKGDAYAPGADPSLVEAEVQKVSGRTRPVSIKGRSLEDMTDEELNNEIDVLNRVKMGMDTLKGADPAKKVQELEAMKVDVSIPGVADIVDHGKIGRHAKDVQRMRALNLNRGERRREGSILVPSEATKPETLPNRTPEELQTRKRRSVTMAQQLEKAAAILEHSQDPQRQRAGDALRVAASEWKQKSQQQEIDEGDYEAAREQMLAHAELAGKVNIGLVEEADIERFLNDYDS